MTPEQMDAEHEVIEDTCLFDDEPWPCTWELRRAHLAAALAVVEAAQGYRDAMDHRTADIWPAWSKLAGALRDYDAHQHHPAAPVGGQGEGEE